MTDIIKLYNDPPTNWEITEATHFVYFPWKSDWRTGNSIAQALSNIGELEQRSNGDLATKECTPLWSKPPNLEGAEIITNLGHKSLLVVDQERVGQDGRWHFVTVTNTNPDVDGLVGYIGVEETLKLPGIAPSLPMNFTCYEKGSPGIKNFCSFTAPIWHETTEPYFDVEACEYLVSVVTDFVDTGGEALKTRMKEQIPAGVGQLLEFYDKERNPGTLPRLLSAFKFAEAKSWHLNLSDSSSRLKVLISVPARYFDAIAQKKANLREVGVNSIQTAVLVSSRVEDQIDELINVMKRYDQSHSWKRVAKNYSGPKPSYGDYDFAEEARKLNFFVGNLRRLLVLNGKNLRSQFDDIIEVGFDKEYRVQYIMLSDDEGSHNLTIGFNRLKETTPFNYPRTMAYVFFLFEISNELRRSKEISGGWESFLKKYTFPIPNNTPSSKSKKCKPSLTDPLKCMGPKFDDYRNRHLRDFKCENLPPSQKMALTEIGEIGYQAIQTGELADFLDPTAPAKSISAKIIEKNDIAEFKEQIQKENDMYGGSMDFVGDPFVEELFNEIREGDWKGGGELALNKLYTDVANPFNIEKIISLIHRCICSELEGNIREAEANGASDVELIRLRAASTQMGCSNPCAVIPVLCSCIPIPWPPKFSFPDNFHIGSIMGYLTAIILNAIIDAIIDFLIKFITRLLKQILDCDRKTLSPARRRRFLDTFKNNYPWEDDDDLAETGIAEALRNNQIPAELARPDLMNALVKDTALLLTPREFCELINGAARRPTLDACSMLMQEKYPELYVSFSNIEKIKVLYLSIGSTIDPSICRNLDELLSSLPNEPAGYICEETELREDMAAGRATSEQISQMLAEAAKCNTDKLESIINLVEDLSNGNDLANAILGNIFASPTNPNGIVPRDPPSVQYLREVANDAVFNGVENKFYSEMNSNVTTLVSSVKSPEQPQGPGFLGWATALARQAGGSIPQNPGRVKQNIAKNFGSELKNLDPRIGFDRTLISIQVPERRVRSDVSILSATPGSSLLDMGLIPGYPPPSGSENAGRLENIKISYSICQDTPTTTNWNRIRDVYTVQIEDAPEGMPPVVLLNFDGNKVINEEFLGMLGSLQGLGSPSQEAWSNVLVDEWMSLPGWSAPPREALGDPTSALAEFHRNLGFNDITRDLVKNMADQVSKSRFLDLGTRTFSEAYKNLTAVEFAPHPSCNPRAPGLLNLPEVRAEMTNRYNNDLSENPDRYINSVQYGAVVAYLRVIIVHQMLDGIFAFSQFTAEDIFKSDLMVNYFLNRIREDLSAIIDVPNFDLWAGPTTSGNNFYEEVKVMISSLMIERKYVKEENFVDPFTNEEVEVQLDPRLIEKSFEGFTNEEIVEQLNIATITNNESLLVSQVGPLESVNNCEEGPLRAAATLAPEECEPETDSNATNETSSGAPDIHSGKRSVGYFELFLKEQLKAVAGEADVLFATEGQDIYKKMIGSYAKRVDVPVRSPIGPARFYKNFQASLMLSEASLEGVGRTDLLEVFEIAAEEQESRYGDQSGPERTVDIESLPGSFLNKYRERIDAGESIFSILQDELAEEFVRPGLEDSHLDPSSLLRPEFTYLKNGGFVTETYIKITELDSDKWWHLEQDNQLAVEKIRNRDRSLKGIVNINSWESYFSNLIFQYGDQLDLFEDSPEGTSLNFKKYFKKWEFGLRLVYVYPIALAGLDTEDQASAAQDFIRQTLMNEEGGVYNERVEDMIINLKSYTIKERVKRGMVIKGTEHDSLNDVPIFAEPRTFDVVTLPLVTQEREIGPTDTVIDVGGDGVETFIFDLYDFFMREFYEPATKLASEALWRVEGKTEVRDIMTNEIEQEKIVGLREKCPVPGGYTETPPRLKFLRGETRIPPRSIRKYNTERERERQEEIDACQELKLTMAVLETLDWEAITAPSVKCYPIVEFVDTGATMLTRTITGVKCQEAGAPPPPDAPPARQPGAVREYHAIKRSLEEIIDQLRVADSAQPTTTALGGQWLAYDTYKYVEGQTLAMPEGRRSAIEAQVLGNTTDNEYPSGTGIRRLLELTEKQFHVPGFVDGQTPIERCFIDGNENNIDFLNRRSSFHCRHYDSLYDGKVKLLTWQGKLTGAQGGGVVPAAIAGTYHGRSGEPGVFSILRKEMAENLRYRTLFEYVFPLNRFMNLITIYSAEHVAGLPGRSELFDDTKELLRKIYYDAELARDEKNWWKVNKNPRSEKWWEQPLELSIPGILFMTPYKILQALLILVPPLNWFLDGLLSLIPDLPPHRSNRGDPCD